MVTGYHFSILVSALIFFPIPVFTPTHQMMLTASLQPSKLVLLGLTFPSQQLQRPKNMSKAMLSGHDSLGLWVPLWQAPTIAVKSSILEPCLLLCGWLLVYFVSKSQTVPTFFPFGNPWQVMFNCITHSKGHMQSYKSNSCNSIPFFSTQESI